MTIPTSYLNINAYLNNGTILDSAVDGRLSREQTLFVADIISEGPIEGLVNQEASVYLEGVPIVENTNASYTPPANMKISFSGTTGSVSSGTLPELSVSTSAKRYLFIRDVGSSQNVSITVNTELDQISLSTSANRDTSNSKLKSARLVNGNLVIPGDTDGSSTFFPLYPVVNVPTDSGWTLYYDEGYEITSISSSSVSINQSVSASNKSFFIGPLITTDGEDWTSQSVSKNSNSYIQFRNGELNQPPMSSENGVGSTSVTYPVPNGELKQVSNPSAFTTIPFSAGQFNANSDKYKDSGEQADGTAVTVTGTDLAGSSGALPKFIDEARLIFTYPSLINNGTKDGRSHRAYAFYSIQIAIKTTETSGFGDYQEVFPTHISHGAESSSPVAFQHTIDLEPFKPFYDFRIRVARLSRHDGLGVDADKTDASEDGNEPRGSTLGSLSLVSGILKEKFIYPYTAYAGVTFSSRDYSSVPQRTYECRGLKIKVPSNYKTREETGSQEPSDLYDGFWDGSFREGVYTDNPAWIFYDIITNNRYGAGEWLTETDVDKYALYRIARFCDELVDDGKGGLEPRFRANIYLTKATEAYKILKDFATVFTGMLYWMDGKVTPVADTPSDPVYNFTKGNVIDGRFEYETTGNRTRINQVIVTWNDPNNNYEAVPVIVEDRADIAERKKIIPSEAVAFGCTSEGQAVRYGRWKLFTAQYQKEVIKFSTALSAMFLQPGDIINVGDSDRGGLQRSGRISKRENSTTTTLYLDRSVTFDSNNEYEIGIVIRDTAAFYASTEKTSLLIGGNSVAPGARIEQAYILQSNGSRILKSIDSEEEAANAYATASSDEPLPITWKPYTYVANAEVVNPGTTTTNVITLSEALPAAPSFDSIWVLKDTVSGVETTFSYDQYRILSIAQTDENIYSITAVEHNPSKYNAINIDYSLAEPEDEVYTRVPLVALAPKNVYVLTLSNFKKPKEEIKLQWDAPENASFVSGYEIEHNISGVARLIEVPASQTSYSFDAVPNGTFVFRVRTVLSNGAKSDWVIVTARIDDPFEENVKRAAGGLVEGAISTTSGKIVIEDVGGTPTPYYVLDKKEYAIAPLQNPFEPLVRDGNLYETNIKQKISGLSDVQGLTPFEQYLSSGFIYFDASDEQDTLKLAKWDFIHFKNLYYWRDDSDGNETAQFTSIGGNWSLPKNSNRLELPGGGLSGLDLGTIFFIGTDDAGNDLAARIAYIESDTVAYLDRSFNKPYSGTSLDTPSLAVDFREDCLLARVYKKGGEYFYDNFFSIDPTLYDFGKSIIVDSNIAFLNYDSEDNLITDVSAAGGINLIVDAVGFSDPVEFEVTFDDTGLSGSSDTSYQSATSGDFTYVKEIDNGSSSIPYDSGSPITFTVSARSSTDPENSQKNVTKQYSINKIREGAVGEDGKTLKLTSTDYSIIYDKNGVEPSYNGIDTDSDTIVDSIGFTATANFQNAIYRFTINGSVGDWQEANTASYLVPSDFSSWTDKSILVEVDSGVKPDGWIAGQAPAEIEATDSISIFAVKVGLDGLTVILSNDSHTLPAANDGTVTSNAGSGTTIEVIQGGKVLAFENNTVYETLSDTHKLGKWTISNISADTSITPGTTVEEITADTNNIVTIPAHSFGTGTDLTEQITYTIKVGGIDETIERKQSFSKSLKGDPGVGLDGGSVNFAFTRTTDDISGLDLEGTTSNLPENPTGENYTWSDSPPTQNANDPLWAVKGSNSVGSATYVWGSPFRLEGEAVAEIVLFYKKDFDDTDPVVAPTRTYNFVDRVLSSSSTDGWTTSPPALENVGDEVYISSALFVSSPNDTAATPATGSWSAPVLYSRLDAGETGASVNFVFVRSTTDLSTEVITEDTSGTLESANVTEWFDDPPAGTAPLWAAKGFQGVGETEFSWGFPYRVDGSSVAEVFVYKLINNPTETPEAPPTATYDFTNNIINWPGTPPDSESWTTSLPSIENDGDTVYVSVALFVGGPLETAAAGSWSPPVVYTQRTDGVEGAKGKTVKLLSNDYSFIYDDRGGNPSFTDGPNSGEIFYTVQSDGEVYGRSLSTGWEGSEGSPKYTWNTPANVEGSAVAEIYIYSLNNDTQPVGGSYNFTTSVLTPPSGWSTNPPTLNNDEDKIYAAVALFSGSPLETEATATWTSPVSYFQDTDSSAVNIIFKRSATQPSTPTAYNKVPTGWSDNPPTGTDPLWSSTGITAKNLSGSANEEILFSPDGLSIILFEDSSTPIAKEYVLETAYDVNSASTSASYSETFSSTYVQALKGACFSPDGRQLVLADYSGNKLIASKNTANQSDPNYFRVSNYTLEDSTNTISVGVPTSCSFSPDGKFIYVLSNQSIIQFKLEVPNDITQGAIEIASSALPTSLYDSTGMSMKSDGTVIYLVRDAVNYIARATLSTPYDINTLSTFSISSVGENPRGIVFAESYATVTATANNFTEPLFKFSGDGVSSSSTWQTEPNIEIAMPDRFAQLFPKKTKTVTVEVAEDDGTGSPIDINEVAKDTISIFGVREGFVGADGTSGFTVILSNEAHSVASNSDGSTIDFSGSGTTIEVFEGGTNLKYNTNEAPGTYDVDVSSSSNVTSGGSSTSVGSNIYTLNPLEEWTELSNLTGSLTITVNIVSTTGETLSIVKKQTFSLVKAGSPGESIQGDPGEKAIVVQVYKEDPNEPDPPEGKWNFTTNSFDSLTSGWSLSAPSFDVGTSNKVWVSRLDFTESSDTDTGTIPQQGIVLSGLVTFTSANPPLLADAETGNTTKIDGGAIEADTITSTELKISNSDGSSSGIFMDADSNCIKIYDGTSLRVKLGNLS